MPIATRIRICLTLAVLLAGSPLHAAESFTFGIVPQQTPVKTVQTWGPLLKYLSERTGRQIYIKTAKDIPTFEQAVLAGTYDFAYMNPAHYVSFHASTGYQALVKAKDKKIHGILVVKKDGGITRLDQLKGQELAFPAPGAFAATIVNRSELLQAGIQVRPAYVASHDSVYLNVAAGRYPAGGGVWRTLKNMPQQVRDQLTVLHTTRGYTPHAIAMHPRVSPELGRSVQMALAELETHDEGSQILGLLKLKGFEAAEDKDWADVRALNIGTH